MPIEMPSKPPSVSLGPSDTPSVPPSMTARPSDSILGSISGNVKEDVNNDDVGDANISGVVIVLRDASGRVVKTTTTDSLGNYLFGDLNSGSYTVMELTPSGYVDVSDVDGGDPNNISITIGGPSFPLDSTGNDFVDERGRLIAGVVSEDTDNDDVGEIPIRGMLV